MIYKDIGIQNEDTFGASVSGDQERMHIRKVDINVEQDKKSVAQYKTGDQGDSTEIRGNKKVSGKIDLYATLNNLKHSFELVTCSRGVTTTGGSSVTVVTYRKEGNGLVKTKTIQIDRGKSQEKVSGLIGSEMGLEIRAGDRVSINLGIQAKDSVQGVSLTDSVGETMLPLIFADFRLYWNSGLSIGDSPTEISFKSFRSNYSNRAEGKYRWHGREDRTVGMFIQGKPTVEGNFTLYHEGTTFTELSQGMSYGYMRLEGTFQDMIIGTTPYRVRIDYPKVSIKSNVRNYEQAKMAIEDVSFKAFYSSNVSTIWIPTLFIR